MDLRDLPTLDAIALGVRQRCICHKPGNVWDAVADKESHQTIRREAAAIYDVQTADEACKRLSNFASV